ncbi:hypothetical protein GCM10023332_20400 [Luteimonas vadosa]|uniref:Uncharacterized protein n=1 Tax=Luteimonas vadosa TaxID=1165507 RepID=A0ABP9E447_9GAMM
MHGFALLRRRIDVRTLALVALEQALAVHDLHQAEHAGISHARPFALLLLVHLLDRAGTEAPEGPEQAKFGRSGLGNARVARHGGGLQGGDVDTLRRLDQSV